MGVPRRLVDEEFDERLLEPEDGVSGLDLRLGFDEDMGEQLAVAAIPGKSRFGNRCFGSRAAGR